MTTIRYITCNFGSYDDVEERQNLHIFSEENDNDKLSLDVSIESEELAELNFIKSRYYKFFGRVEGADNIIYHDANIDIRDPEILISYFKECQGDYVFIYHPYFKWRIFEMFDAYLCNKVTFKDFISILKLKKVKKFTRVNGNFVFMRRSSVKLSRTELLEFIRIMKLVRRDQWIMPEFLIACGYKVECIDAWKVVSKSFTMKQHKNYNQMSITKKIISRILRKIPIL